MKKFLWLLIPFFQLHAESIKINLPMDGWYTINSQGKKQGYFFSRYEWVDAKQTQIKYSSVMIRDEGGKFFEEQLQEISTVSMKPVSLRTRKVGEGQETFVNIDFAGNQATIETKSKDKSEKKTVAVPEETIFGSFVNFLFLSIKPKMAANKDYTVNVIDEGDYSIKDCRMRLLKAQRYSLTCDGNTGDYEIDKIGLITYQAFGGKTVEVKKTTMQQAMKGFPKPGERKL